jgi:hypothetical protein
MKVVEVEDLSLDGLGKILVYVGPVDLISKLDPSSF